MSTAIQEAPMSEQLPVVVTPGAILERAYSSGASPELLARLLDLQERWMATQSRMAFDAALAQAKGEIGPIAKNRHVFFKAKNGGADTNYRHEDLAEIARTVDPILTKYGLSYTFKTHQDFEAGGRVTVTCKLRHSQGHIEETTLSASPDSSGNKNNLQAVASSVTYLQRYTLKAALGLAVSNDDDAQAAGGNDTIDSDEAQNIRDMIAASGADEKSFLNFMGVSDVSLIRSKDYDRATEALRKKASSK